MTRGNDAPVAVNVSTYIGNPDRGFTPIADVGRYERDPEYVEGALCLTIDGVPVMTREEWDDVNWLWPFLVNASDECARGGRGETMFPDQPLCFSLERIGSSDRLCVSLTGNGLSRSAVATGREYYAAIAAAGLEFFEELERLVPGSKHDVARQVAVLEGWRRT